MRRIQIIALAGICALLNSCENHWIKDITEPHREKSRLEQEQSRIEQERLRIEQEQLRIEQMIDQMNEADFGTKDGIRTINTATADLEAVLNGITAPGNYVVNVSGNPVFGDYVYLGTPGVTISLRGNGGTITGGWTGQFFGVYDGAKLILREITLQPSGTSTASHALSIDNGGTIVMEAGSAITGSMPWGAVEVYKDGSFIMNGGSIHNFKATDTLTQYHGIVDISGQNARFEKNMGAVIYGTSGAGANTPVAAPYGHVVCAADFSTLLCYRDTTMGANEALSVTINGAGTAIASQSGYWQP